MELLFWIAVWVAMATTTALFVIRATAPLARCTQGSESGRSARGER
ncbi:MAG: hypothetical protein ACP5DC_10405 [Halothiobacillaceae bacterium]